MSASLKTPFNVAGVQYNDGDFVTLSFTNIDLNDWLLYSTVYQTGGTPSSYIIPPTDKAQAGKLVILADQWKPYFRSFDSENTINSLSSTTYKNYRQLKRTSSPSLGSANFDIVYASPTVMRTVVSTFTAPAGDPTVYITNNLMTGYNVGPPFGGLNRQYPAQNTSTEKEFRQFLNDFDHTLQPVADTYSALSFITVGEDAPLFPVVQKVPTPLFCIELQSGNYIAFRSALTGKYLHMMEDGRVVLSNLSSSYPSAQWTTYQVTSGASISLLNRARKMALTGSVPVPYASKCLETQWIFDKNNAASSKVQITHEFFPTSTVIGDAKLGKSLIDANTISAEDLARISLTISKPDDLQGCRLQINALSSACTATTNQIQSFCSSDGRASSRNCATWAIANPLLADGLVKSFCAANPNDLGFCGCTNVWPYRETNDVLSYTIPPTAVLPTCNLTTCASNGVAWKDASQLTVKCNQQICLQSVRVDSATNSEIKNSTLSCKFGTKA